MVCGLLFLTFVVVHVNAQINEQTTVRNGSQEFRGYITPRVEIARGDGRRAVVDDGRRAVVDDGRRGIGRRSYQRTNQHEGCFLTGGKFVNYMTFVPIGKNATTHTHEWMAIHNEHYVYMKDLRIFWDTSQRAWYVGEPGRPPASQMGKLESQPELTRDLACFDDEVSLVTRNTVHQLWRIGPQHVACPARRGQPLGVSDSDRLPISGLPVFELTECLDELFDTEDAIEPMTAVIFDSTRRSCDGTAAANVNANRWYDGSPSSRDAACIFQCFPINGEPTFEGNQPQFFQMDPRGVTSLDKCNKMIEAWYPYSAGSYFIQKEDENVCIRVEKMDGVRSSWPDTSHQACFNVKGLFAARPPTAVTSTSSNAPSTTSSSASKSATPPGGGGDNSGSTGVGSDSGDGGGGGDGSGAGGGGGDGSDGDSTHPVVDDGTTTTPIVVVSSVATAEGESSIRTPVVAAATAGIAVVAVSGGLIWWKKHHNSGDEESDIEDWSGGY